MFTLNTKDIVVDEPKNIAASDLSIVVDDAKNCICKD